MWFSVVGGNSGVDVGGVGAIAQLRIDYKSVAGRALIDKEEDEEEEEATTLRRIILRPQAHNQPPPPPQQQQCRCCAMPVVPLQQHVQYVALTIADKI